ncbi:MAG: DNA-directed RNA polymerase [Thermoplasmata archaeon]|nr:MAG: DNA-directed RNA polymerase [Thermoplasmata archaeon]
MYAITEKVSTIRIPPERLMDDYESIVETLAREQFEGKVDNEDNIIVLVLDVEPVGEGRIVHGDGAVYQDVKYRALVFKPQYQEVVTGTVCDVVKFGAFVRIGPIDGLLHISQIMDDHIDVDLTNQRLIGKETKRDLRIGDKVRVRVVTAKINERSPRESKIGLTMRQPALGKFEWIEEERKEEEEEKKGGKGK